MMQPALLGFLRDSFERFLQLNVVSSWSDNRYQDQGLNALFKGIFPIRTKDRLCALEYVTYNLEKPKYDVVECLRRGITFAAPIKLTIRLIIWEEYDAKLMVRDIKEQEVYFGEVPLLTERCTFIYNGAERHLPSRLQRREGVFFSRTEDGDPSAQITSWYGLKLTIVKQRAGLRLQLNIPEEMLLSAAFQPNAKTLWLSPDSQEVYVSFDDARPGRTAPIDLKTSSGDIIVAKKQRITAGAVKKLRAAGVPGVLLSAKERRAFFSAEDVFYGGELILGKDRAILGALGVLQKKGIFSLRAYSLMEEPTPSLQAQVEEERALLHWFDSTFKSFDLSARGRLQLNHKLSLMTDLKHTFLQRDDLSKIVERLHAMSRGSAPEYDPNHLGELALHCVGERLMLHAWFGLTHLESAISLRINSNIEREVMMPCDVLDSTPFSKALRRLLAEGSEPLDATNPLSILSQLRRVETPTEFTPHPTHQAMLSHGELALLCRPNEFLFLESPYVVLEDGHPRGGAEYLSAYETERFIQDGAVLSPYRAIDEAPSTNRRKKPKQIELVACSPLQELSLLEAIAPNQTASRAILAAPALYAAEPPRETSALGAAIVKEAGCVVASKGSGEVAVLAEDRLWLSTDDASQPVLEQSLRGLQAVVSVGQRVEAGASLADGITSRGGVLSLGRETKVLASQRSSRVSASSSLLRDFTSRHLIELECVVSDTKLGAEYLQREIPEVDAAHSAQLDEDGVIRLGAVVGVGDVLVGKYTPTTTGRVNASLYVSKGQQGRILSVEAFFRKGTEICARKHEEMRSGLQRSLVSIQNVYSMQLIKRLTGAINASKIIDDKGALLVATGAELTLELLQSLPPRYLREIGLTDQSAQRELDQLLRQQEDALQAAEEEFRPSVWGDALPPGVISLVKVTIEQARPLAIGDTLTAMDGRAWCIEETFEASSSELRVPSGADLEEILYLVKTSA